MTRLPLLLLLPFLVFAGPLTPALAEMTAITVAASVLAHNEKSVTLQIGGRRFTVPRKVVKQRKFSNGEAILVTFQGDELKYLFASFGESNRIPASEKK